MEEEKNIQKKEPEIVPSYAKKQEPQNNKKTKQSGKFNINKKRLIFLIIAVVIICMLIFGVVYLVRVIKFSKYNDYSEKFDKYGLSELYNNGKSTSHQTVTKAEALKVIISSIINVKKISIVVHEEAYKNEDWVNYAVQEGIISEDEINKSNASSKVTFIEFIKYYANARIKLLGHELNTSVYPNYSDITTISAEELYALSDLIYNNVIENSNSKIKPNRKLYKGELNKLAIDIIEKYNIMIPDGEKFNINEDKNPDNIADYPYTVYDVKKEVYEKEFIKKYPENFKKPVEVYPEYRESYNSIEYICENYYKAILNIDYETITVEKFMESLEEYTLFEVDLEDAREYVEYVKKNKIKISGSAKAQTPILYNDGSTYRLRTYVNFEILNSSTKDNILYLDLQDYDNNVTYENTKYEFYVDTMLDPINKKNKLMYVWEYNLAKMLDGQNVDGIVLTEKEDSEDIFQVID